MPLPTVPPKLDVPEVIETTAARVACDGGGGAPLSSSLGHPRVYLTFGPDHRAVCPYCSRLYVQTAGGQTPEGGSGHH
jgi:uncharacterized Zn-finger protein